jgi:hypothetical protein
MQRCIDDAVVVQVLRPLRLGSFWRPPSCDLHVNSDLVGAETEAHIEYGVVPKTIFFRHSYQIFYFVIVIIFITLLCAQGCRLPLFLWNLL